MNEDNSNTVPWHRYVNMRFDDLDKLLASERSANEQRLGKLNELREEVTRDRDQFLKKDVYDQMHNALTDRVYKCEQFQSRMLGFGTAIVFLSGLLGYAISHFSKGQ